MHLCGAVQACSIAGALVAEEVVTIRVWDHDAEFGTGARNRTNDSANPLVPNPYYEGFRAITWWSRRKNCAEQFSDPQMTGRSPATWRRVTNPSVPQAGHANTAQ